MRRIAFLLIMGIAGCQAPASTEIQGTWRSDRETTLAELAKDPTFPPKTRALLEEILGELEVTYRDGKVSMRLDDWSDSGEYHVLREGKNWIEFEAYDVALQKDTVRRVWVEGDRLWLRTGGPQTQFTEYFERVSR